MLAAFMDRDRAYDGLFFTAVRTTGIFCRPVCSARKPKPEHVEFFSTSGEALFSGYRPCLRCRPLAQPGSSPEWLRRLLSEVDRDPTRRWKAADLRELGIPPERARRWFQRHHGMTFHAYARARRLGAALARIREGASVSDTAFAHGYASLSGFNAAFRDVLGASPTALADRSLVWLHHCSTPLGPMLVGATDAGICLLEFADRRMLERQLGILAKRLDAAYVPGRPGIVSKFEAWLTGYFDGAPSECQLPLQLLGTDFQVEVWRRLGTIPRGETRSYAELATEVGRPDAVRAVARANGDNRLAIVVPCHRVLGSDGRLTGYGGGLWRKRRLLDLESA